MSILAEKLLHDFYAGNNAALGQLAARLDPLLAHVAYRVLLARDGPLHVSLGEWDVDERLNDVWTLVLATRERHTSRWPYELQSAIHWLISVLCMEIDWRLGLRGPF